jgi:hypothetical protein
MAHIPPPYFPEPITVPNNVADGKYARAVAFIRVVAVGNLLSLCLLAFVIRGWLDPAALRWLAQIDTEVTYLAAILSLVALAFLRKAHIAVQLVAFAVLLFAAGAALALWGAYLHDRFPVYTEVFVRTFVVAWIGALVYCSLAGRDFSFVGCFMLVGLLCLGYIIYAAIRTDVVFSEGMTMAVTLALTLFYWLYDMAMILRRRTHDEAALAILDLYRDLLNFVRYPIRVMRMPRTLRRRA